MIGYVTIGSNDIDKARSFYDALMPTLGAGRMLEFGDNFTMYGTGMGRPGLQHVQAQHDLPQRVRAGQDPGAGQIVAGKEDLQHGSALCRGVIDSTHRP